MNRLSLLLTSLPFLALAGLVWLLPWPSKTQPSTAETANAVSIRHEVPELAATERPGSHDKDERMAAREAKSQPQLPPQAETTKGWDVGDAYWEDHSAEEEGRRAEAVPVEPESVWSDASREEAHEP